MPRTACRTAALLAATAALAVSFAGPAQADANTYCFQVDSMHFSYPATTSTRDFDLCIPWPF